MSAWSARVRLLVSVPGRQPELVNHSCLVDRGHDFVDGLTLPVDVDPDDLSRLAIRWSEVPTIAERIASGDPAILDPERTWRRTRARERAAGGGQPQESPWANPDLVGWPPREPLPDGRQPGTAWVVAHSKNPQRHMSGRDFVAPDDYIYRGRVSCGPRAYLGWVLLCVLPEYSERYAVHLRTTIRPAYFASVLPVGIDPARPEDVEILWSYAPGRWRHTA